MDFRYKIVKEAYRDGYKTIEDLEAFPALLPRNEETERILAGLDIVRRFKSPFNASIEVVVIRA